MILKGWEKVVIFYCLSLSILCCKPDKPTRRELFIRSTGGDWTDMKY